MMTTSGFEVVDVSTPATPTGVGFITTASSPSAIAGAGRYAYVVTNSGTNVLQVWDMGGTYTQQLQAGGAEIGTLQVDANATIGGDESIQGALNVSQNATISGNFAVSRTTIRPRQSKPRRWYPGWHYYKWPKRTKCTNCYW